MSWSKLKGLFIESDEPAPEEREAELAAFELPKDEAPPAPVPVPRAPQHAPPKAALSGTIDFQALYDGAGIPNTDEVEALEKFLGGLDASLPQASKLAAAKAFLNAISKAPKDVLDDAGRKISVARSVAQAKIEQTNAAVAQSNAVIANLQQQIDAERAKIESAQKDLENVRTQCAVEEARLQAARVFFGHLGGA